MQMTKAAALAILAFTSSAVAQYPSEYDSALYARDAYAYADPDEYELYAREAEPEFDIHPRDAYMEGYYDGLYSREAEANPVASLAKSKAPAKDAENDVPSFKQLREDISTEGKTKAQLAQQVKKLQKEKNEYLREEANNKKLKNQLRKDSAVLKSDEQAQEKMLKKHKTEKDPKSKSQQNKSQQNKSQQNKKDTDTKSQVGDSKSPIRARNVYDDYLEGW